MKNKTSTYLFKKIRLLASILKLICKLCFILVIAIFSSYIAEGMLFDNNIKMK